MTDASGVLLSENRYTPFGEVRDITGSLDPITQTDFGYTGQRDLSGVGLMDYRYRFLSTGLGRFIQPDPITPNPANPQMLNRYTYANNNPINFNDPSGHFAEKHEGGLVKDICQVSGDPDCRSNIDEEGFYEPDFGNKGTLVQSYADHQYKLATSEEITSLEAMARIIDLAAVVYGEDEWDPNMLKMLTYIFNGVYSTGPGTVIGAGVRKDVFGRPSPTRNFTSTGFHEDFYDGYNQVYHAWVYISSPASPGMSGVSNWFGEGESRVGNTVHECCIGDPLGRSQEDYNLGLQAIDIGNRIFAGEIKPGELGNILRQEFGVNGPGFGEP